MLASEMIVLVEPEELLLKPKSSKQSARFQDREDAFKNEARRQVAALGRRRFAAPRPVSVQLDIHVPEGGQQPLMPGVVKAYLDALEGIAYDDDRQIEHLVVHRRGLDHPMMDGYDPEVSGRKGQVLITVAPLEAYTRLYDRTFRRLIFRGGADSPSRNEWGVRNELELVRLKAKRKTMADGPSAEATDDLIALDEEARLTSGAFADIDRPGRLSDDMRRAFRVFPAHAVQSALRGVTGSRLMLPPRGAGKGTSSVWEREVERRLERHRRQRLMTRTPLRSWVALDIAVRGETIDHMDLDNLARLIITRFEKAYCVRPGTVASYRAYQAVGSPEGVQVRVMATRECSIWRSRSGRRDDRWWTQSTGPALDGRRLATWDSAPPSTPLTTALCKKPRGDGAGGLVSSGTWSPAAQPIRSAAISTSSTPGVSSANSATTRGTSC